MAPPRRVPRNWGDEFDHRLSIAGITDREGLRNSCGPPVAIPERTVEALVNLVDGDRLNQQFLGIGGYRTLCPRMVIAFGMIMLLELGSVVSSKRLPRTRSV
jgi:hypothetical protein